MQSLLKLFHRHVDLAIEYDENQNGDDSCGKANLKLYPLTMTRFLIESHNTEIENQPVTTIQKMKWYHMMYFSSLRSQVGMWKSLDNTISTLRRQRIFGIVLLFSAYSEVIMGQFSRSQWLKSTQWTTGSTWWRFSFHCNRHLSVSYESCAVP